MNIVAKVMMSILNNKLYEWVDANNALTEFQAGFRKRYSTIEALSRKTL